MGTVDDWSHRPEVLAEMWLITQLIPGSGQWLFDWQTLIAGALALFGALVTVHYLNKQIILTENMEIERRRREETALKAVLPMALGDIVRYAVDSIKLIDGLARRKSGLLPGGISTYPPRELPRVPSEAVDTIRDCTRYADTEIAGRLSTLLNGLQVQQARLTRIVDPERKYIGINRLEAIDAMI